MDIFASYHSVSVSCVRGEKWTACHYTLYIFHLHIGFKSSYRFNSVYTGEYTEYTGVVKWFLS